jgi:Holliday junction resolvasome RuvABC ATP-dependent DNA helicase subunit
VDDFNSRNVVLMPITSTFNSDKLEFIAVRSSSMEEERFMSRIMELTGTACCIDEIEPSRITLENSSLISTAKALLPNQFIRSDTEVSRWQRKSIEEAEAEINNLIGFEEFKKSINGIKHYIENTKLLCKKTNNNIILVKNVDVDVSFLAELIYDFYYAHGIILDPTIAEGDVGDAVNTERNTKFLYNISETWREDNEQLRHAEYYEKQIRTLLKRKTIYITTMNKKQYEAAKESIFTTLFPTAIFLNELSAEEKVACLNKEVKSYGFTLIEDNFVKSELIKGSLDSIYSAVSVIIKEKLSSPNTEFTISISDFKNKKNTKRKDKSAFEELEELIGLSGVKNTIKEISTFIKNRGRDNLPCLHFCFKGNPGTAKTTVARIIGKIFAEIGAIQKADVFIEADRNALVSRYLGGTAAKTTEVVESALGGVLFIDEAYSLCNGEKYDYGVEAVSTLVKLMEDHRSEFVCILAGYTDEIDDLLDMNPGIRERIQFYIDFPDYDSSELTEIFTLMCKNNKYKLNSSARRTVSEYFSKIVDNKDKNFANGRIARKVFERVKFKQAFRGISDTITKDDIEKAFEDNDLQKLCTKVQTQVHRIGFVA